MQGTDRAEVVVEAAHRSVAMSHPDKVVFPEAGLTKLDLVQYYVDVASEVLVGIAGRPLVLKRYPNGAAEPFFFQKRVPSSRPAWIETCTVSYPSGRSADLVVCRDAACLAWLVQIGCVDMNPWPVQAEDPDHPDELRVDLDPTPGTPFEEVRAVALEVGAVLESFGLCGFPKTSGSRGIHITCAIQPRWGFDEVRRAALALAREVERRMPGRATSAWWKEERHGVFLDYNQNARDRTVASAYSVRAVPDARVSCPLDWSEVATVDPSAWRLDTVRDRLAARGDAGAGVHDAAASLDELLQLADAQARGGQGDAPWPPHFPKARAEPRRVAPSRAASGSPKSGDLAP